jgi:hypothetical protein
VAGDSADAAAEGNAGNDGRMRLSIIETDELDSQ